MDSVIGISSVVWDDVSLMQLRQDAEKEKLRLESNLEIRQAGLMKEDHDFVYRVQVYHQPGGEEAEGDGMKEGLKRFLIGAVAAAEPSQSIELSSVELPRYQRATLPAAEKVETVNMDEMEEQISTLFGVSGTHAPVEEEHHWLNRENGHGAYGKFVITPDTEEDADAMGEGGNDGNELDYKSSLLCHRILDEVRLLGCESTVTRVRGEREVKLTDILSTNDEDAENEQQEERENTDGEKTLCRLTKLPISVLREMIHSARSTVPPNVLSATSTAAAGDLESYLPSRQIRGLLRRSGVVFEASHAVVDTIRDCVLTNCLVPLLQNTLSTAADSEGKKSVTADHVLRGLSNASLPLDISVYGQGCNGVRHIFSPAILSVLSQIHDGLHMEECTLSAVHDMIVRVIIDLTTAAVKFVESRGVSEGEEVEKIISLSLADGLWDCVYCEEDTNTLSTSKIVTAKDIETVIPSLTGSTAEGTKMAEYLVKVAKSAVSALSQSSDVSLSLSQRVEHLLVHPELVRLSLDLTGFSSLLLSSAALVSIAAIIDHLLGEITELAGYACRDNASVRMSPRHLLLALSNDEALCAILGIANVSVMSSHGDRPVRPRCPTTGREKLTVIRQGGVMPFVRTAFQPLPIGADIATKRWKDLMSAIDNHLLQVTSDQRALVCPLTGSHYLGSELDREAVQAREFNGGDRWGDDGEGEEDDEEEEECLRQFIDLPLLDAVAHTSVVNGPVSRQLHAIEGTLLPYLCHKLRKDNAESELVELTQCLSVVWQSRLREVRRLQKSTLPFFETESIARLCKNFSPDSVQFTWEAVDLIQSILEAFVHYLGDECQRVCLEESGYSRKAITIEDLQKVIAAFPPVSSPATEVVEGSTKKRDYSAVMSNN